MRDWKLTPGNPLHLTLAADARLGSPDYSNDHIWQLELGGGDPAALGLRTTYGLRARLMRIFPRFLVGGRAINDPAQFAVGPKIQCCYPNFVEAVYSPLPGVDVVAEYWIPDSAIACGRITLTNRSVTPLSMSLEWVAQLIPIEGQVMSLAQRQSVAVLEGQLGSLTPVFFLTGGPQPGPGPYPGLVLPIELPPTGSRQLTWAMASLSDPQASFDLARQTAARHFDAERAKIEMLNHSQTVEIITGDVEWDAALALSQKAAFGLLMGPSANLPYTSFVLSRHPDLGHSPLGDGTDHGHLWNGQSALDAYYLATLLPGAPEYAWGVLRNFLKTQEHDGAIDARPGLAGQRSRFMAAPYLAAMAWRLYKRQLDPVKIKEIYPALHKFFWAWFSPLRDRDRNGLPEWQHVLQTGFAENPLFDGWHSWALGVNITVVQSPALSAALYQEAQCLIKMAGLIGRNSDIPLLQKQVEILTRGIEACWDADGAFYHYVDRDTHLSLSGKMLSERQAAPVLELQKEFRQPVRLVIRIYGQGDALKRPRVTISGFCDGEEQSESLDRHDFQFSAAGAIATSERVYDSIGTFKFEGLNRKDRISIQTVDLTYSDHTLLLPLWARVPNEQEAQALVYRTIMDAAHFDHPFGIPAVPKVMMHEADPVCMGVHIPWNHLIGEGLLAYGYRREAARLVAHGMAAVIQNLKRSQTFYRTYHAETGVGQGEQGALSGLAPVGLFLDTLGVEILSPWQACLRGENPFPWPVTVKYRGLTISRLIGHTEVIFPNGQTAHIHDPADVVVSMDRKEAH